MTFRIRRLATVPLLALGLAGVAVAPASAAATTYTVKVGSMTTGSATLTAKTTTSSVSFFSLGGGVTTDTCGSAMSTITTTLSTAAKGKKIAKITGSTLGSCTTRDGTMLNVTAKGTWNVNAMGATSSSSVTQLLVSKMQFAVVAPGGECSYDLKGSTTATYDNSGSLSLTLSSAHVLVVSHYVSGSVNHCEEANGDKIAVLTTEPVTANSPKGAFAITSN